MALCFRNWAPRRARNHRSFVRVLSCVPPRLCRKEGAHQISLSRLKTVLVGVRSSVVYPGASLSVWLCRWNVARLVVHWESVNVLPSLCCSQTELAVQQSCTLLVAPLLWRSVVRAMYPTQSMQLPLVFTWLTSPWRGLTMKHLPSLAHRASHWLTDLLDDHPSWRLQRAQLSIPLLAPTHPMASQHHVRPLSRDVPHVSVLPGVVLQLPLLPQLRCHQNPFDKLQCDVLPDLYTLDLLVSPPCSSIFLCAMCVRLEKALNSHRCVHWLRMGPNRLSDRAVHHEFISLFLLFPATCQTPNPIPHDTTVCLAASHTLAHQTYITSHQSIAFAVPNVTTLHWADGLPYTAFSCGRQVPDVAVPHYRDARMQHSPMHCPSYTAPQGR